MDGAIAKTMRNSKTVRLEIASKKKKGKKIIEVRAVKLLKIYFNGERKQKTFGSGWRQLVCEHNLLEGDFLVFEIMEMDDSKLEVNLQVLRNIIPPELEEEIKKREAKSKAKAIYIDDGNKE
ncbi:hypothetical protein DH2020_002618 [Rehmannia glutinosa]|uniref:TF-B3 domain-containing protein n=1 Tax=Rehmannia glutinosa TaxID=99300 RepID=A0ABR0XU85_REHGL